MVSPPVRSKCALGAAATTKLLTSTSWTATLFRTEICTMDEDGYVKMWTVRRSGEVRRQ